MAETHLTKRKRLAMKAQERLFLERMSQVASTTSWTRYLDCFLYHTSLVSEREKTWHLPRCHACGENESLSRLWCFQSAFRQTAKQLDVPTMLNLMLDQMM